MSKRVLCLLADGFEEIETVTPVDLLRRAGAEVVMASLSESLHVTGRSGIVMHADTTLAAIPDPTGFDLLFIPGGPAVKVLREDLRPATLARAFIQNQKPVAAICAAPLVLHDAGLLEAKRYTAHHSTYAELTSAQADVAVLTDGLITTSRGAGTALPFGLELIALLYDSTASAQVAQAIMA